MEAFNWETDRAMSCKALLDARNITDEQAEELKRRVANMVAEYLPGQEGAVKVSIAEAGSRRWVPIGKKRALGEPLFDVSAMTEKFDSSPSLPGRD